MVHPTKTPALMLTHNLLRIIGETRWYPPQLRPSYEDGTHTMAKIDLAVSRKVIGLGTAKVRQILLHSDTDTQDPFGIGVGLQSGDLWRQYMHTVTCSIDIQSNIGLGDHDDLVADVTNIIKYNRVWGEWVDIVIVGTKHLSNEMRNRFRTIIDVRGRIYKPRVD